MDNYDGVFGDNVIDEKDRTYLNNRVYEAMEKKLIENEEKFNLIIKYYEAQLERNKETAKDIYLKAAEYDGKEDSPEKEKVMYELHQLVDLRDGKEGSLLEERQKIKQKLDSLNNIKSIVEERKKWISDIDEALSISGNSSNPEFINFITSRREKKAKVMESLVNLYNNQLEENKDLDLDILKKEFKEEEKEQISEKAVEDEYSDSEVMPLVDDVKEAIKNEENVNESNEEKEANEEIKLDTNPPKEEEKISKISKLKGFFQKHKGKILPVLAGVATIAAMAFGVPALLNASNVLNLATAGVAYKMSMGK